MKKIIWESATFLVFFALFIQVAFVVAVLVAGLAIDDRAVALIAVSSPLLTLIAYHLLIARREVVATRAEDGGE